METVNDKAAGWEQWYQALSPAARRALEREAPAPREPQPGNGMPDHLGKFGFHLFVSPDGEYPRVHSYRRLADLVRQVGKLEGEDVAVICVHGTLLPLTVGTPRYLLHPRKNLAISIPAYSGERVRSVSAHLVDRAIEEEGYLGPTWFRTPTPIPVEPACAPPTSKPLAKKPAAKPTQASSKQPPTAAPAKQCRQEPPTEPTTSRR